MPLARGQGGFTTVTGTVTDPNGVEWSCATISAQLITAGGPAPTLNGGGFTTQTSPVALGCPTSPGTGAPGSFAMRLADSGVISPSNTTWRFTVNSTGAAPPLGTGPQSFTFTTAINCATNTPSACASNQMDISTQLSALAPALGQSTTSPSAPCGANTQVQFNDAGACGADPDFTWAKSGPFGKLLQVGGSTNLATASFNLDPATGFFFVSTGNGTANNNKIFVSSPGSFLGDLVSIQASLTANSDLEMSARDHISLIGGTGGIQLSVTGVEFSIGGTTISGQTDYLGKTSGAANLGVADVAGTPNRMNLPTLTGLPGAVLTSNGANPQQLSWTTNCTSSASPAVCGANPLGTVVIAAAATTVVVNTTAVTANSVIFVQYDSSLGAKLGVTCNVTVALPAVTARTAGTSFTITVPVAPTTNPACYSYRIEN